MSSSRVIFRVHAVQRMFERNLSLKKIVQAVRSGKTVEDYSLEMPEPSRLVLGFHGKRPLHVVISENQKTNVITIITAYSPDPANWNKGFMRRRS